ncbi:hypothetical protein IG631_23571 [Alternaria alternata]|nr:hypothetical protein IG631_23571 [Alternaria alternata]
MIFAHKSSVNCLVKSGCLNYKPPLGDELRKTVQSNLIDRAGEDDVNTLGVRYRCLRRGSSTAENTDIDMSPSLSRSSRMKQDAPNDVSLENGSKRRSIIKDVPHEADRGRVIEDSEDGEGSRRKKRKRHSHNKIVSMVSKTLSPYLLLPTLEQESQICPHGFWTYRQQRERVRSRRTTRQIQSNALKTRPVCSPLRLQVPRRSEGGKTIDSIAGGRAMPSKSAIYAWVSNSKSLLSR